MLSEELNLVVALAIFGGFALVVNLNAVKASFVAGVLRIICVMCLFLSLVGGGIMVYMAVARYFQIIF